MSAFVPDAPADESGVDLKDAKDVELPSAAERLAASRERMREWMLHADGRYDARRRVEAARDVGSSEFIAKTLSRKVFTQRVMAALINQRNFIKAGNFFGPDRRRQSGGYTGVERRKNVPTKTQIREETVQIEV